MMRYPDYSEEDAVQNVGPGWEPLIRRLYAAKPEDVEVHQVKEKFGGLRFYIGAAPQEYRDLVDAAENESYTLCATCGKPGTLDQTQWWVLTLCDEHKALRSVPS